MRKRLKLHIFSALLLAGFASGSTLAHAETSDLAEKMAALKKVNSTNLIRSCLHSPYPLRVIGNTCTRALDSLVTPVAQAKDALAMAESITRVHACEIADDFECTPSQIQNRFVADLLADALWQLRLTEDNALSDRRAAPLWDRVLVSDNRVGYLFAEEFIDKAMKDYEQAAGLLAPNL